MRVYQTLCSFLLWRGAKHITQQSSIDSRRVFQEQRKVDYSRQLDSFAFSVLVQQAHPDGVRLDFYTSVEEVKMTSIHIQDCLSMPLSAQQYSFLVCLYISVLSQAIEYGLQLDYVDRRILELIAKAYVQRSCLEASVNSLYDPFSYTLSIWDNDLHLFQPPFNQDHNEQDESSAIISFR